MGILVAVFTLCRILFLLFNNDHFPVVYFTDFLAGFWFDLVTAAICFLPLVVIEIFPNRARGKKWFQIVLVVSFHIILFLSTFINLIDVEYFRHTSSRSTVGLFQMLGFGDDLGNQLPSFFSDYWYILIFAILLQLGGHWLYKRVNRISDDSESSSWLKQIILFPIACGILVLIGRGGTGMKPIAPANAAGYTIDQNVQLILNSAFCVIKTWGDVTVEEKNYFEEDELPIPLLEDGKVKISASRIDEKNSARDWFCLEFNNPEMKTGIFPINENGCSAVYQSHFYGNQSNRQSKLYHLNQSHHNFVNVSRLDTVENIISGTFSLSAISNLADTISISSGRFDLQF